MVKALPMQPEAVREDKFKPHAGEEKMQQLYKMFQEKDSDFSPKPPPLSPKQVDRTPVSGRKISKKSKLILRAEMPP